MKPRSKCGDWLFSPSRPTSAGSTNSCGFTTIAHTDGFIPRRWLNRTWKHIDSHNFTGCVNSRGLRSRRSGDIDSGVDAVMQQETVERVGLIGIGSDDFARSVDAQGVRLPRIGYVEVLATAPLCCEAACSAASL